MPLWVNIRTYRPDLTYGRTLGLPLFGHLDLEVVESTQSEEDVYAMLANVADYLIGSDATSCPVTASDTATARNCPSPGGEPRRRYAGAADRVLTRARGVGSLKGGVCSDAGR